MGDFSPNLTLPYLLASQTQKHVTLNESLNALDALVMLSVKDRTTNTPPASPIDGDRYIIAASPTGAWAGKANQIALYINSGWQYFTPKSGYIAYVQSESLIIIFDGNSWINFGASLGEIQNLSKLGIGTNADTTNPISAKINKALFSAKYVGETGNGDIQYVFNKEATANKISILFQKNWSGRAEFGLVGNDNLSFKVSPDGSNWKEACNFDNSSARVVINYGVDYQSQTDGSNEILRFNGSRFLHLKKSSTNDGYNIFLGENAGNQSLSSTTASEASRNCGFGQLALTALTTGYNNVGLGSGALSTNTIGANNTAIGYNALKLRVDGSDNINYSNCVGLGNDARVSASNQVQLGNSTTTTYAYGAVQNRSDARDKTDIRDTLLGLEFICALRPVDFKWDYREDYEGTKNGSKKRNRYHHGLIAQEVAQTIDEMALDFGGYQDHSLNGGDDVKSIGYSELIAPLIKAIQELKARIDALSTPNA